MSKNTSKEWRTLLNPAFCGEILRNTIKQYEKHDEGGLPFTLVFFILPLILHPDTYNKIRNTQSGQFFGWLDKQFLTNIDLENRISLMKSPTLDSIAFLSFYDGIEIVDGKIKTKDFDFSLNSKDYDSYMAKFHDKSIQIGRWLSQSDSLSTLYMMFGVTP